MKTKQILTILTILSVSFFVSTSHADDITATNSGNWSDPTIWGSGTVPGTNDDADIPAGINVVVDTNVTVQFIYDSGTVIMAPNSTLDLTEDQAIDTATILNATAVGNTVIYSANPFFAKQTNYYNLVLANTNYVDLYPPYYPYEDFNNFSSAAGPTPMTVAGDMTVMGYIKVQQGSGGAPITIGGNLIIGTNCIWDCSGDNLTVASNLFIYGLLEDLNGALGSNYIGGNVTVVGPGVNGWDAATGTGTNGWDVSDVTTWGVGGSLTNNGFIFGKGYGSISFDGAGVIAGSNDITIPTMTVAGNYTVGTTITLTTNTPTLNGTLTFDIANTNQIIFKTGSTNSTLYYSGGLDVINSGSAPVSGSVYQFFSAASYGGTFSAETLPALSDGLSWIDTLTTDGSISVTGTVVGGSPMITTSQYDSSSRQFTLTWTSQVDTQYTVQETSSLNPPVVWNSLQENISSGGDTTTVIVTMPEGATGFLRIVQQ